jgi:hypothetical protein
METWENLKPPFSRYSISDNGKLKNNNTSYIFNNQNVSLGYVRISLIDDYGKQRYKFMHNLVAETFLVKKDNCVVNHKDENKQNNCVGNLEYVTQKQNINLVKNKRKSTKARQVIQYDLNMNLIKVWEKIKEAPFNPRNIVSCCANRIKTAYGFIWRYAEDVIENETWKNIEFNDIFLKASNKGRIKLPSGLITYGWKSPNGYLGISVTNKHKQRKYTFVHRLVALAFLKHIDNDFVVNHKDFNKQNNCVENLEWVSQQQNSIHSTKNWTANPRKCKIVKISANKIITTYESIHEAASKNNTSKGNICLCCQGKRKTAGGFQWKYSP